MTTAVQRAREASVELVRMGAALLWVALASAATLAALGAVPGWLAGETHEIRRLRSVEAAERWVQGAVALPSYFPERLRWPPAEIRVAGGVGGAVALRFAPRDPAGPAVELYQSVVPGVAIPPALLGVGAELGRSRTTVGPRPAERARVLVGGVPWEELRWERDGLAMVARTQGDVDELLRMARSAHRRGAP